MPSTTPTDPRPLREIEHELDSLLVRYADLEGARLKMTDVLERVHAGDEVDAVLTRMGELQAAIAAAPARDIADAAVKLRRLAASLSLRRGIYERRLVTSALAAVEAAAVTTAPGKPLGADVVPRVAPARWCHRAKAPRPRR